MKISHLSLLLLPLLIATGCKKKPEAPAPQPDPAELSPQTSDTANAENPPVPETASNAAATQTAASGKVKCGKNEYDADTYKDWICLNGVMRCLNQNGCKYKGKSAPMRTYLMSPDELYCNNHRVMQDDLTGLRCLEQQYIETWIEDGAPDALSQYLTQNLSLRCNADKCGNLQRGEEAKMGEHRLSSFLIPNCEPTRMPPGTTCKNDKVYCGDAEFPGEEAWQWRCVQNQWLCIDDYCECAGGTHAAGKFGTCKDGKAWCGDKESDAIVNFKPTHYREGGYGKGYICQNNKWVCANPEGCGECEQYQTLNAKGKCEGKSVKPNIKLVECKEGNCPCGNGACPKDGACLTIPGKDPICTCGKYHEEQYCLDRDSFPFLSNNYGEFSCHENHESGSSGGGDYYYDVMCENEDGCHVLGETKIWEPPSSGDDDGDWVNDWTIDDLSVPSRYDDAHTKDAYDQAFLELEFGKCGRSTALEFKTSKALESSKDTMKLPSRDSCAIRKACDTMPVPRANRKNYTCDFIRDPQGAIRCYSWLNYNWVPIGLRCNADTGCTCNQETCAKGQLCVDGVCRYDTVYAQKTCQNVYPHLAPDEPGWQLEDEGGTARPEWEIIGEDSAPGQGLVHVLSPSDPDYDKYGDIANERDKESYWPDEYEIHEKVLFWDNYDTDVENILVTGNGTCICGYSEVIPKKLSDYKCVQSLGYVCLNPNGCECGSAQCQKGSLCLREGLCSSVVMDKGLNPEKISNYNDEEEDNPNDA